MLSETGRSRSHVQPGPLVAIRAGHPGADPWITIAVAVIIARTGWSILRATVPVLVDERAVDADRIQRVAESVPDVNAAYGIRSRGRPGEMFRRADHRGGFAARRDQRPRDRG